MLQKCVLSYSGAVTCSIKLEVDKGCVRVLDVKEFVIHTLATILMVLLNMVASHEALIYSIIELLGLIFYFYPIFVTYV